MKSHRLSWPKPLRPARGRRSAAAAAVTACALLCTSWTTLTLCPASLQAAATTKENKKEKGPGAALYRRAEKSFRRQNLAGALALLDRADAAGGAPKADVLNLRGAIFLRQKRFTEAREKFSAAISADPKLWVARYNLAEVDLQEGRYGDSRRRLSGLLGRAAKNGGPEAREFVQYKLLLADLLAGREEPVIRYLSEHRSADAKKPDAGYCYLSAALADRRGETAEAERWRARARRGRAPAELRRLFAVSFQKFDNRLATGGPAARDPRNNDRLTRTTPDSSEDEVVRRPSRRRQSGTVSDDDVAANDRAGSTHSTASSQSRSSANRDEADTSDAASSEVAPTSVAMLQLLPAPPLARSSTRSTPAVHTLASKARPEPSPAASANASEPPEAAPSIGDTLPSFRTNGSGAASPSPLAAAGAASSPAGRAAAASPSPAASAKPTPTPTSTPAPPTEAFNAKYEAAFVAFSKRDYAASLALLEEADKLQPGQADSANLRGLIYARQRLFDQAEVEFRRAVQLDPTFWAAKFNLADLPFSYRNYGMARTRFEALLADIDPVQLPREAELTQFKIFLCLLLEGKEPSARAWMTRFKFEGATPARLYALAALDFHAGNFARAVSWIDSAKKQFPPQLEALFAESFYRIGWLTNNATLAQNTPGAGAADSAEPPIPTPAAPTPTPPSLTLEVPTPSSEPNESNPFAVGSTANSTPAASPSPTPVVAAATPTPAATPVNATPSPTAAANVVAAATPTPQPQAKPTAVAVNRTETDWTDRFVRVVLPAFVLLYLAITPFFMAAALLRRSRRRKARRMSVPARAHSDNLARSTKL